MTLTIRPADVALAAVGFLAALVGAAVLLVAFALWLRGHGIR